MLRRIIALSFLFAASISVSAAEYADAGVAATFKLFNHSSTATCVIVNAGKTGNVLVTAAHVFEKMKGDTAIIVLRKPKKNGSYGRHDVTIPIRKDGNVLWQKFGNHDLAVMKLELKKEDAALIKPLPLAAVASAAEVDGGVIGTGDELRTIVYPHQFEANGAGFPVVRKAVVASHPVGPVKSHHTFLIDGTTFAGDSGGPVIVNDRGKPKLVGIIQGQHWHNETVSVSSTEDRVKRYALHLAYVLHADFVRQAIEKLGRVE
jgi:V8-like Glu-specific endopeptidase